MTHHRVIVLIGVLCLAVATVWAQDHITEEEDTNTLGHQLADKVEHFLTTYFVIPRERLSLQVALTGPTAKERGAPLHESQRWRLKVFRRE